MLKGEESSPGLCSWVKAGLYDTAWHNQQQDRIKRSPNAASGSV